MNLFNKAFFILLMVFLIVSCNNSKNEPSDNNKKIVFWHFWSEPNQLKIIKELITKFEKENNCSVETVELSWNDGKTKLFAAFNSGTAPDVLELGSDWVAQFSSVGVLKEFNPQTMNFDKYIEFSKDPSLFKGKLFAIPWIVDTRVLFYNKNLMEKAGIGNVPPANFQKLYEYSEKISNIEGYYGFGANGSDVHRLYKKLVTMFWTYGGDLLDKKGNPVINSTNNVKALEMYIELSREGMIETQRQIDAAFTEGKIGFWISGGWLLDKIQKENPNLNFDVALIPGVDNKKGISFAGGEYLASNAKTKSPELAEKFIKYMTDGKNSIEFCKQVIEAGFPADKNFYKDNYYQSFPKRLVFAEQLNSSKMTPVNPKWLDIESIIEYAAVEALYGRKSSQGALDDAQQRIVDLLKD
jgi:ABC-type glycerol-3-phosphate transport system substrate-binding protein